MQQQEDMTLIHEEQSQEVILIRKCLKQKNIDAALDPKGVIRECCDNEEHPNTLPVILALDVTGSMGQTAVEIAKRLNIRLYEAKMIVANILQKMNVQDRIEAAVKTVREGLI